MEHYRNNYTSYVVSIESVWLVRKINSIKRESLLLAKLLQAFPEIENKTKVRDKETCLIINIRFQEMHEANDVQIFC